MHGTLTKTYSNALKISSNDAKRGLIQTQGLAMSWRFLSGEPNNFAEKDLQIKLFDADKYKKAIRFEKILISGGGAYHLPWKCHI